MKAINIQWDVDDVDELENLPTEITIPSELEDEDDDDMKNMIGRSAAIQTTTEWNWKSIHQPGRTSLCV